MSEWRSPGLCSFGRRPAAGRCQPLRFSSERAVMLSDSEAFAVFWGQLSLPDWLRHSANPLRECPSRLPLRVIEGVGR